MHDRPLGGRLHNPSLGPVSRTKAGFPIGRVCELGGRPWDLTLSSLDDDDREGGGFGRGWRPGMRNVMAQKRGKGTAVGWRGFAGCSRRGGQTQRTTESDQEEYDQKDNQYAPEQYLGLRDTISPVCNCSRLASSTAFLFLSPSPIPSLVRGIHYFHDLDPMSIPI